MKKKDRFEDGICVGVIIIIIALIGIGATLFYSDTRDVINTKSLGTLLCREQGMEYSHRVTICRQIDGEIECNIPKIYCKGPEKELVDGVVVTNEEDKQPRTVIIK